MKDKRIWIGAGILFGLFIISSKKEEMIQIENITDQLTKSPTQTYQTRQLSQIDKIVLHHSATTSGTPQAYANYHVNNNGWPGIGYHFVIQPNGTIYQTNNLETLSYHVQGNNTVGIGVCMTGNFDTQHPTTEALESLNKLVTYLRKKLNKNLPVKQHRMYANKSCPGQNLYFYPELGTYSLNGIGKIYQTADPRLFPCKDGTFTDAPGHGACQSHGGILNELDSVTDFDLEQHFYKELFIAEMLTKTKFSPESWRQFGDSQLAKEKFMFLKDGGARFDQQAQELTWQTGVEITPQDIVDVILVTDNPYTYINEMRKEVLELQKRQAQY